MIFSERMMQIGKSIRLSKKYGLNATIPSCFWCGQLKNEVVLMGKLGRGEQDLEAPFGMLLDYEPCDACWGKRDLGVTLIEVTEEANFENQPEIQEGLYPTGKWCVIKDEAADRIFGELLDDNNIMLLDREVFASVTRGYAETK